VKDAIFHKELYLIVTNEMQSIVNRVKLTAFMKTYGHNQDGNFAGFFLIRSV
jgi:hypothetical protein